MKFENCLIASDYDGTFYADDGSVPQNNINAIRYFIDNGGRFTVSTGRVAQGFNRYDPAYINAPCLVGNGAAAFDYKTGRYSFINGIGREGYSLILALMNKFPNMPIEIYSPYEICAIHMDENTRHHFTSQMFTFKQIDMPYEASFPWVKVMVFADKNTLEVQSFIKNYGSDPSFLPTTGSFIEILKKGTDKGTGLYRLADSLGIPRNRTFAVGDGYNDVDMLKSAKFGFVPSNGSREALACADYVVCSNNDGAIANVIEILDSVL